MILLDCGNSQIKAQCWRSGLRQENFSHAYTEDWENVLTDWLEAQAARQCYLCSVLDSTRQGRLDALLAGFFPNAIARLGSEAEAFGVVNGYTNPAQLGVDRWLALLAAADLVGGDCMIIDAGSAITLDLLDSQQKHLGGAILPGCHTSLDDFKRIFNHIDFSAPEIRDCAEPGSSTVAAIQIDYVNSSIEALSDLVERWSTRLSEKPTILLAGGDAYRVQRELHQSSRIVPDLVFRGMLRMANA